MLRNWEVFCRGRAAVSRLSGYLAVLVLAGSALALPLAAEEITVTIPTDPPAQAVVEDNSVPAPMAEDTTAPPPETQQEAAPVAAPEPPQAESAPAPAAEPVTPKPAAKTKKAAAPAPAADTSETPAHADAAPAKPKAKKVSAAASCKKLDETACGSNSACIWVVGTPAEGTSKGTTAGCRSLAAMKKEAEKAQKAAKTSEPEVLPWASHTGSIPANGAAASTGDGAAKPAGEKKTKTATTKKTAKPKAAVPAASSENGDQAAPPVDAPAASGSD